MEIQNETVYNSQDIWDLFQAVCVAERGDTDRVPKKLRVGYYSPTPTEKLIPSASKKRKGILPSPFKWINFDKVQKANWRRTPRLGIARPMKLHRSPLEQLGAMAPGDMILPQHVIRELVLAFALWAGAYYWDCEDDDGQLLPHDVKLEEAFNDALKAKVRYTLRAKKETRLARAAAKKVKTEEQINALEHRIREARNWEIEAAERILNSQVAREKMIARYRKLCGETGKYPYY